MAKAKENEVAVQEESKDVAIHTDIGGILDLFSDEEMTGYENLDNTDFKLTRLKIIQNTSEELDIEGVKAGEIYNSTTKQSSPSIKVTIADISKSRVLWPEGPYKRGDTPICRSGDGRVGHFFKNNLPNSPKPEGGEFPCAQCPYSKWGVNKDGSSAKPPCNLSYSTLVILNEEKTPARINFGGTSYSEFKDFINQCMQKTASLGRKVPANIFNVIIGTRREKNDKGIYFVADLKFDPDSVLSHPTRGDITGIKSLEEAKMFRNIVADANTMFGDMMTSVASVDEESKFIESAETTITNNAPTEESTLF